MSLTKDVVAQHLIERSSDTRAWMYRTTSKEFDHIAFDIWASEKLMKEILLAKDDADAFDVIENFAKKMDRFSTMSGTLDDMRFSVAYDVAMDALDAACSTIEEC